MAIIIFILIVIGFIYLNSFMNTPSEYKLSLDYQFSSGQEKLNADIIEGLRSNIKIDILNNNDFNRVKKRKEIENFIAMREATFYIHIEALAQKHKLSHDKTFNTIFEACNSVRWLYGIPKQITNFSK
jgi:hypothetical protein